MEILSTFVMVCGLLRRARVRLIDMLAHATMYASLSLSPEFSIAMLFCGHADKMESMPGGEASFPAGIADELLT